MWVMISPMGRRQGLFGFGATKMSRLRRWGGVLSHDHEDGHEPTRTGTD